MKPLPLDYCGMPPHRTEPPSLGTTVATATALGLFGGPLAVGFAASFGLFGGVPVTDSAASYVIAGLVTTTIIGVAALAHVLIRSLPVFRGELLLVLAAYLLGWSWVGVGGSLSQVARFGYAGTNVSGYIIWGFAYGLFFLPLTYALLRGSLAPVLAWRRRLVHQQKLRDGAGPF